MSAFAGFPWVYAACNRAAADLAGLPLVVYQGRGAKRKRLDDHPLYQLLDRPSRRVTGRQFRAQQVVDLILAGNHFAATLGTRDRSESHRLHPRRVSIKPDPHDGIGGYVYEGAGDRQVFDADHVTHVRMPSWSDDPRGMWGTGAIETLHDDLTTDRRAARSASTLAKRGRPDVIISPKGEHALRAFGDAAFRDQLKARLDKLLEGGGTLVVGAEANVELPSWAPRDIEFPALRQLVREAVLAVTGVPPHMVGLPTATYAADRAQEESYWGRQRARAADISDACWNVWARMWGDDLYVEHDFSGVPILQESRSAALDRVIKWYTLGMLPSKAAAMEGLSEADFSAGSVVETVDPGADGETPAAAPLAAGAESVADTALNGAQVSSLLEIVLQVSAGTLTADAAVGIILVAFPTISEEEARRIVDGAIALPKPADVPEAAKSIGRAWLMGKLRAMVDARRAAASASLDAFFARGIEAERAAAPVPSAPAVILRALPFDDHASTGPLVVPRTAEGRAELWRGFLDDLHTPVERRILASAQTALREQAERIAERLRQAGVRSGGVHLTRNVTDEILLDIFAAEAEDAAIREAMTAALRDGLSRSYGVGARQTGRPSLTFDPVRLSVATDELLADLVVNVNGTTKAALRSIVRTGLSEGDSVSEMAARIVKAQAFSPGRALTIARTEATRSVNGGALLAYEDAAGEGVGLRVQWLSARDSAVRPSHQDLDGQTVEIGGKFKIGGDEADGPGGFSEAAEVVNCRCTVVPVVSP
jgi:HK97 family phage portal protein